MLVFRERRRIVAVPHLLRELKNSLAAISSCQPDQSREALLIALLQAGELECALADAAPDAAPLAAALTDALASCLVENALASAELHRRLQSLSSADLPSQLTTSTSEGFAYYALHPLDYIKALAALDERPHVA